MASNVNILITGATGYIGGAVLNALMSSEYGALKNATITCVVRGAEKAKALEKLGVKVLQFQSLDETEILAQAASENDVVIHTASGFHTLAARALILGLARRKQDTGREVFYFQTSGTSNVGDRPITGQYIEKEFPLSDQSDIFSYLKKRDFDVPYAQRTSDIVVTEVGLEVGVKTVVMMLPSIYGTDTKPLHEFAQTPMLIRAALKLGKVPVIGDGSGIWDHVHIQDVARCYEVILNKILIGEKVPTGKEGIFFVESGEHTWRQLSQMIADAGVALDVLKSAELWHLSLEEFTEISGIGRTLVAEVGGASNARTRGHKARSLGWKPLKTETDFEAHAIADWRAILASNEVSHES
ncbi:NAD dependent epimerase/dehydratase family protein [Nemania sp. FL0916]|nr:NAD dependent epimerase/dehydratase family protein [Nemania sp. FL0916]